jgi:transposase
MIGGGMLGRRVYAYGSPVDMRKGFDGLYSLVREFMKRDPLSGDCYLFVGRDRTRAKVLLWDGSGLCIYTKRLERGRFAALWGQSTRPSLELSSGELELFLEGCALVGRMSLSPPPLTKKSFHLAESRV